MKLKNILLMGLSLVLVASLAIGGTVAYLQDDDSDVNVMTLGNVSIEQHEYERVVGADGKFETITTGSGEGYKLQPFTQAKPLYPTTNTAPALSDNRVYFDQLGEGFSGSMKAYDESVTNVLDKYVLVENTGKTDAYVRTLIAYEAGRDTDGLVMTASRNWTYQKTICTIEIDGATYAIDECVYNGGDVHTGGILPAGEVTIAPCLGNIYAKYWVDNEWCEAIDSNNNGTWDVLVLSQAVQAEGFADAKTALDTAFGETNAVNAAEWFGGVSVPTVVSDAEDLTSAIAAGEDVVLLEDIVIDETLNITTPTEIDLNGHNLTISILEAKDDTTISGGTLTHGKSTYPALSVSDGTLTLDGVDVVCNEPCNVTYNQSGTLSVAEYVGIEIWSGECVLNNSTITVNCTEKRYGNSVFGIGIHAGEFTMNGGSITVTSAGSHQAKYEYQAAIFAGSETDKVINLNNVTVNAKAFLEAWGGNTVVNTTDAEGTWDGLCTNRYTGSHVINYGK